MMKQLLARKTVRERLRQNFGNWDVDGNGTGVTPACAKDLKSAANLTLRVRHRIVRLAREGHCNSNRCGEGSSLRKRSIARTAAFFCV